MRSGSARLRLAGGPAIARAHRLPYIASDRARGERRMLLALIDVVIILLKVVWWIIVIQMILSWLVAFNVINTYNDFVRGLLKGLDRITEPVYRPIRKVLPDFGGLDFSPMVVLLVLWILNQVLYDVAFSVAASYR
jgi:YggT family protein